MPRNLCCMPVKGCGEKPWPVQGLTMVGLKRLDNLDFLIGHMLEHGIPGDFIECVPIRCTLSPVECSVGCMLQEG